MNRYKATLILILASTIYVLSYPFHKTFVGGIVYSGSCGSMIGGFADWWGINKLLKKTIPKNKQNIFDGLSNMVSEELLTKETLKKLLNEYNISEIAIKFVKNNNELEDIKTVLKVIIENNNIDRSEIKRIISKFTIKSLKEFNLHKLIVSVMKISLKTEYEDKVLNFILGELILFSKSKDFKNILIKFIDDTRSSYEHGNIKKRIIDKFKGSNNDLASDITQKIEKFLINMRKDDNESRLMLKQWLYAKVDNFEKNNNYKTKIESLKIDLLENVKVEEYINIMIEKSSIIFFENNILYDKLFLIIKNWLFEINKNVDLQRKVDVFLKNILNKLIDNEHKNISKTVKENLNKYTDTMLIELIESNVGNDLQLIRINGSLVGGIVGILMFIIKYSIGV
ncbi:DUF445 domain-containing protein [Clostridium algoriphilum]|uniref:DUF445 domain-containing protein n=1 Tax=Clostridium algoriphilum TaxID=198347 RepID=UPI001CF54ADC|nr:DUF445 domain-containing protein [Clostridium algoriphilum]MCB2292498.1 DUF445 domain-containing protein [Clostridium algoriphilum]